MASDAKIYNYVSVAQLDRVLASDAKGCEFEPRRIRQTHNRLSVMEGLLCVYKRGYERAGFRLRARIKITAAPVIFTASGEVFFNE